MKYLLLIALFVNCKKLEFDPTELQHAKVALLNQDMKPCDMKQVFPRSNNGLTVIYVCDEKPYYLIVETLPPKE
jgi:hypothetical protein